MSMLSRGWRILPYAIVAQVGLAAPAAAQDEPFAIHDTKPVITHGRYLVDPTETAITVVWMTDTPSHSKVLYGTADDLTGEAEPVHHGLLPVGTLHAVRLNGIERGRTYRYRVVSTRVVELKPYWPEKGLSVESPVYSFTTFDREKPTVSSARHRHG